MLVDTFILKLLLDKRFYLSVVIVKNTRREKFF